MRRFRWFPLRSAVLVLLPLSLAFVQAASAGSLQIFGNTNPITINDNTINNGIASPYPSQITVSGVNPATVTKVQVILNGFSHSFPDDVDIILVGPQGQRAVLMSDAGGSDDVVGLQLSFSQTAATPIPDETTLTSAQFRPANYENGNGVFTDNFPGPSPAPGTLTDAPADLSVFNLTDPNGVWSLYVVDDTGGDTGSISTGWLLQLTVPTIFTVNSTADTDDGVCDATCTLREAINAAIANTGNGDLINFSSSGLFNNPQTITLLTALPDITESITIQGPGANLLTVRRDFNAATDFSIFTIAIGITNGVAISGMTISNGRDVGGAGQDGFGGGIDSLSDLTLTGVHVTGNEATTGGGVALAANGTFTNCTFSGNRITNSSGSGGGIRFDGDGERTLRVANSTISGNSTGFAGAGIQNISTSGNSRLEIVNSTITGNTAALGGGGIRTRTQSDPGATATTTLRNTIVAGNSPTNLEAGTSTGGPATVTSNGFNLSDDYNGFVTLVGTDKTGQPLLGPLSLIGGQTPTHALLAGSPALDAGDASGLATDQRGQPRVFGASADIGAVEMRPLIVTTTADSGTGSLRGVLKIAESHTFNLTDILFDETVFNLPQTITLTSGQLVIGTPMMIHGPGATLLTVQRDPSAATFGIFGIGMNSDAAFSGMTITGGNTGSNPGNNFGGGISTFANLTLTNVRVSGNQADTGGGVDLRFGDGIFTGCTFSGNTATIDGGGISYSFATKRILRIVNSTVSGNHSAGSGGGIRNVGANGKGLLEITNSTIANNTGGGILTFTNSGAGNTATTTLRNTIIAGNTPTNLATGTSGGGATTVTTYGFNLANDSGGGFLNVAPITTDKINANAGLAALADNLSPTPTHALLFGSAALDAGNNSGSGILTDQRGAGFSRSVDLSGVTNAANSDGTDIGAYEAQTAPPSPTPTPTATATATPAATATATATAAPTATPTPTPGLVGNVSTRLPVGIDENVLIEGFIVQGPTGSSKKIIVRAIGPSLIPFGITDALANPTLEIHDSTNAIVATNDDWKTTQQGGLITSDQTSAITASQVAPSNDLESAIIGDLAPGSYTAVVRGLGNTTGTGVVDAYDLSAASPAKLANIATRGLIQPGDKLMIAGFIIQNGSVNAVIRAIGPSLIAFGIANALPDTTLQLRDQNGNIVLENDDWQTSQKQELESIGLQPTHDLEAAVVTTLQPGQYTAQVRGKGNASGIGVVQVYFLQ